MSRKLTPFGLRVKVELLRRGMTQKQLEQAVSAKSGLYVDSSYSYKILTGQRSAPKIVQAIKEILELEEGG